MPQDYTIATMGAQPLHRDYLENVAGHTHLLLVLRLLGMCPERSLLDAVLPQAERHKERKGGGHDGHDACAVQHRHHHHAAMIPRIPQLAVCSISREVQRILWNVPDVPSDDPACTDWHLEVSAFK